MQRMQLKLWTVCALSGFLLLAGCDGGSNDSQPRAAVQGTVLLDDVPLETGVINFIPTGATKGPMTTAPIQAGKFSLPDDLGPLVGTHRVEIESCDLGGLALDDESAIQRLKQQKVKHIKVIKIPAVYNRQSQLQADIQADADNQLGYRLTTKRSK